MTVEVNEHGTSMADEFELPLDDGIFTRSGVKMLLKTIKKKSPNVHLRIDKKEKSIKMFFGKKMATSEVFQMVDNVIDLLDTKMCPVCGIGLFLGYEATLERFCKGCRKDYADYMFLLEPVVVSGDDLESLSEYDILDADLKRLERIAVDIEISLW